jgi:hypothetical protein
MNYFKLLIILMLILFLKSEDIEKKVARLEKDILYIHQGFNKI